MPCKGRAVGSGPTDRVCRHVSLTAARSRDPDDPAEVQQTVEDCHIGACITGRRVHLRCAVSVLVARPMKLLVGLAFARTTSFAIQTTTLSGFCAELRSTSTTRQYELDQPLISVRLSSFRPKRRIPSSWGLTTAADQVH